MPPECRLPWQGIADVKLWRGGGTGTGTRSKQKYTCADCGANLWGKPGLKILCAACREPFSTATEVPPAAAPVPTSEEAGEQHGGADEPGSLPGDAPIPASELRHIEEALSDLYRLDCAHPYVNRRVMCALSDLQDIVAEARRRAGKVSS